MILEPMDRKEKVNLDHFAVSENKEKIPPNPCHQQHMFTKRKGVCEKHWSNQEQLQMTKAGTICAMK